MINIGKSPIEEVTIPLFQNHGIKLLIKREDQLHPHISGNKWRKLKYNLMKAKKEGNSTLLTFGGAYSNHIYATAAAVKESGFRSIGIIRGEETLPLNPTLSFAKQCGMVLHYVNRNRFRKKYEPQFIESLRRQYGDFYFLPEGGTNGLALKGCAEMVDEIKVDFDIICCPAGTGGTLAGIISALKGEKRAIGYAALKGNFLEKEIENLLTLNGTSYSNWEICSDSHFGGYAKFDRRLIDFINQFHSDTGIGLDPIYTGKMMYGICKMIEASFFEKHTTLLAIHTGGLQGIAGFNQRFGNLINT